MREIVLDWIDFCEDRKDFDKSYFYPLFHDNCTKEELQAIVQCAGYVDTLQNLSYAIFRKKAEAIVLPDSDIVREKVNDDFLNMQSIFKNTNQNYMINREYSIEICGNWEEYFSYLIKYRSRGNIFDSIADTIYDYFPESRVFYAFYEALYGIENDYDLARAIINPYLTKKIDYASYFELYKINCHYLYLENENRILCGVRKYK
jgi:hypothetical protein